MQEEELTFSEGGTASRKRTISDGEGQEEVEGPARMDIGSEEDADVEIWNDDEESGEGNQPQVPWPIRTLPFQILRLLAPQSLLPRSATVMVSKVELMLATLGLP